MQLRGKVLLGTSTSFTTKKGTQLDKTKLKVQDQGPEIGGDVLVYWIDFLGEYALSDAEMQQVLHQEANIEIRRVSSSLGKDGKAYLNLQGGAMLLDNGQVVQAKIQHGPRK